MCFFRPNSKIWAILRIAGEHQTVPRAELSVIVTLEEFAAEGTILTYVGDNKPVIDLYNKGRAACKTATNADLYNLLYKYIDDKHITLKLIWMPSHLDDPESDKVRPGWVTDLDILGNGVADALATWASNACELDLNVIGKVIFYTHLCSTIQLRLATIICNLPNRAHHRKITNVKLLKISFEEAIDMSRHLVHTEKGCAQMLDMHGERRLGYQVVIHPL